MQILIPGLELRLVTLGLEKTLMTTRAIRSYAVVRYIALVNTALACAVEQWRAVCVALGWEDVPRPG